MAPHMRHITRRRLHRGWRGLRLWQRVVVVGVLLGALAIGAGLIYFAPGARTSGAATPATPATSATDAPLYPPGTRYYYRRSQWLPWDQQQPVQP